MFGKFACAILLAATSTYAVRINASSVCITNYLNETIYYQSYNALFYIDSAIISTATATTSCQDMSTFVAPSPIMGEEYNIASWYGNEQANVPYVQYTNCVPYITYEPTAGQVNYFCGYGLSGSSLAYEYCCCAEGTTVTYDICYWDGDMSYTSCEAPSHITQP